MYNLLISYYFSILFDVLHEKFGVVEPSGAIGLAGGDGLKDLRRAGGKI